MRNGYAESLGRHHYAVLHDGHWIRIVVADGEVRTVLGFWDPAVDPRERRTVEPAKESP